MGWIEGIPDAEAVRAHESDHPRPDGVRLGDISVDRREGQTFKCERVICDDRSYGEWICYHYASRLQPYVSVIRLKEVNGEVLAESGLTAWHALLDTEWAAQCRYFPVGVDGLPIGFIG